MKFISVLFAAMLISFCGGNAVAQDCQVLLSAIAGKYTGGYKQGKAEGNGKSIGKDQYTGQFKAGFPDGKGTYTWANGDVFKGEWIKGLREGEGSLAIKRAGKADSVVNGTWKSDVYSGVYVKPEKPFIIHHRSNYFSRTEFRKDTKLTENSIELIVSNVSGGINTFTKNFVAAKISDINIINGSYGVIKNGSSNLRGTSKKLMDVVFPFRAALNIGGEELDFEINDPGAWTFTIVINQ